jgi:hypothetical protein
MASPRARAVVLLTGLAIAAFASPAAAVGSNGAADAADQIVLSGPVMVPRGADAGEVVVVHGSVRIDGVAHGDVVVIDGPAVVHGQVSGSVIAVDGAVTIGPGAQINGDVTARRTISIANGARIGGRVRQHVAFAWRAPADVAGRFASWLAVSVSTLLLGLALVLFTPRALDAAAVIARSSPWRSTGWALAIAVGVPVVCVLFLASLVALPLGLVTMLALGLLAFVGYVVAAFAAGRALFAPPANRALAFAIGWAILRAIGAIPVVSGVTFGLAAAYGLGASAVAMWRARAIAGRHRGRRRAEAHDDRIAIVEEAGL